MGGRGSSSGVSDYGNKYGSQYKTVLKEGNIKFVQKNSRTSETLMETTTKGRVYVTVGGNDLLQIIYFDQNLNRSKTIDLSHTHYGKKPHTHHGYIHSEHDSPKGYSNLTTEEKRMVDRVERIWNNRHSKR